MSGDGGELRAAHGREAELTQAAQGAFERAALTVDRRKRELDGYEDHSPAPLPPPSMTRRARRPRGWP